jgi:peroxiredoxin
MLDVFAATHPDIDVVAVTFDEAAVAREFATKRGFQWPVVADAQEYIKEIGSTLFQHLR